MPNPATKLQSLLKLHRFELDSQKKHLKYKNPQGKVYIMSKTPSDFRAGHRALTVLQRVIASPVPTSELLEEERQRKELEASIVLEAQRKPLAGIAGAGKGKKSNGTGFIYDEMGVKSLAQIAHEERQAKAHAEYSAWLETEEGLAWRAENQRRKEELAEQERKQQTEREWKRRLYKFRRTIRQVEEDKSTVEGFAEIAALLYTARKFAAQTIRRQRHERPKNLTTTERKRADARLLDRTFVEAHEMFSGEDDEDGQVFHETGNSILERVGLFLMYSGGRVPVFYPPDTFTREDEEDRHDGDFPITLGARDARLLRLTVAWCDRVVDGINGVRTIGSMPAWLRTAVLRLHKGVNLLPALIPQPTFDGK